MTKPTVIYHPPAPAPIQPQPIEIVVLTPQVTGHHNDEVARGDRLPYTYFAMSEQDYLTLAGWLQDVLRHLKQQREIIGYYRKVLEPDPDPPPD